MCKSVWIKIPHRIFLPLMIPHNHFHFGDMITDSIYSPILHILDVLMVNNIGLCRSFTSFRTEGVDVKLSTSTVHKQIVLESYEVAILDSKHIIKFSSAANLNKNLIYDSSHNITCSNPAKCIATKQEMMHKPGGSSLLLFQAI